MPSKEFSEQAGGDASAGEAPVAVVRSSSSLKHRRWKFAIIAVVVVVVGVYLLIQLIAAQRIPDLTEARLDEAEALWQRVGPADYDMELDLRGAQPGAVKVQVRNGEVATMLRNGRTPPPWSWRFWSVPGQFETIGRDLVLAEDPVHETGATEGTQWHLRCEFDSRFGYPQRYHRFVSGGGPEVYWNVTRFEPK